MSQAIHCPGCNKKYSLPANPPATFTCRQCGTLMDLSDFGGQEPPPKPARTEAGGAPRSRRTRAKGGAAGGGGPAPSRGGGGGRGRGAPPPSRGGGGRARGGRSRRGAQDDHDDGGGRRAARARKENNNAVIIGAAVALVVVIALVVIILGSKDDTPVENTDAAKGAKKEGTKMLTGLSGDSSDGSGNPAPAGDAPKGDAPKADTPKADAPKADGPKADAPKADTPKGDAEPKKPKPLRNRTIRSMKLGIHDWPEEVDAETRAQVDEAIPALYRGGRDSLEAREFLESKGRAIAGRLISEFKRIDESPGFDNKEGASMAGVIDSVLRALDGWQERRFREEAQIRVTSTPSFTLRIAKRWTAWWVSGEWKNNPRKPWDPHEDSFDDPEPSKKKKSKGTGFKKRAGG